MLIPSIDLQGGAVVQLVQGERLAIRDEDIFKWVRRFERFPKVQVIDLDAAMGAGDNLPIVRQIAPALTCRVGGGVRTAERARDVLAAGARQIIAGSSLFKNGRALQPSPVGRASPARPGPQPTVVAELASVRKEACPHRATARAFARCRRSELFWPGWVPESPTNCCFRSWSSTPLTAMSHWPTCAAGRAHRRPRHPASA